MVGWVFNPKSPGPMRRRFVRSGGGSHHGEVLMPKSALPPHLQNRKHNDFPPGLRWISRGWTAWNWGEPRKLLGSQQAESSPGVPQPIGEPGTWQISIYPDAPWWACPVAWYFAVSLALRPDGWFRHFRIGARYDSVDSYTEFPSVASRRFPAFGDRDTTS